MRDRAFHESGRLRKRADGESGQVLVLSVLALLILFGMAAFVVDIGRAYYVQRSLQSSADAAALAAAQELPDAAKAADAAREYGGAPGGKNARDNVTGVETKVELACVPLAPCRPVNAVFVTESVEIDTIFARVLGIERWTIKAKAGACSPCATRPLDVMLVLDRTGSMCQDHYGRSDPSCTDLQNAKEGIRTFLGFMDPAFDRVGLAVLPPATGVGSRCSTPPTRSSYDSRYSAYVVVPLSDDYKTGSSLNASSQLVSTVNCLRGGGVTSYATALEHAQSQLEANGRPDIQDVIVFLSDGAANYGPSYYPRSSPYRTQPCRQGVSSAAAIKSKGTIVYSIGYDLNASGGGANVCRNGVTDDPESPSITAYAALEGIASGPDEFFNQPGPGELSSIYAAIAGELTGTRLIE